jgi:hypothetical protein
MTGCADDFMSLSPKQGTITVAGGIKLHIHGVGTVRLRCILPDGSTRVVELTNTLYNTKLFITHLFSWSYIRHRGLEFYDRNNDVYLSRNSTPVLWAKPINEVVQTQTDTLSASASAHNTSHGDT